VTSDHSDGNDAGGSTSGVSVSGPNPERGERLLVASGGPPAIANLRRLRDGLWRVAVAEESMAPALRGGDWLLLDPTVSRWPRRGSVVVFHEPDSDVLAIKRVAAGPGDRVWIAAGILRLGAGQAWLLGDNAAVSIDSRRYGPVELEALVARAWFRYAPIERLGPISPRDPARP
jgi:hypothetical protein